MTIYTEFTVIRDEQGELDILAQGYWDEGKELDEETVERLENARRAFRVAENQINPERLKETARDMRDNTPLLDVIANSTLMRLLEPFEEGTENKYDIDNGKAWERVTRFVQEMAENIQEDGWDIWEDSAHWVWLHLMAHTLLEMVEEYGGWEALAKLPDLEERFDEWLFSDDHMGAFRDRFEHVTQMYADQTADELAKKIKEEGSVMEALALDPIPDNGSISEIPGMLHIDGSKYYHQLHSVIAAAKDNFEGEGFPMATNAHLEVKPPYKDFNPSLMAPDELTDVYARMWGIVRKLGDRAGDVLDAILLCHIQGKHKPGDTVSVNLNDILDLMREKKVSGKYTSGYKKEHYKGIMDDIHALAHLHVTQMTRKFWRINDKGKRELMQEGYDGALISVAGERWLKSVETGIYEKRVLDIRINPVVTEPLAEQQQYTLLPEIALKLNHYQRRYEKRLIRYLSYLWRVRQQMASYTDPLKVDTLLSAINLPIDKRPVKTRDRLETALNFIQEKGAIGGWQYVGWDEPETNRREWVKKWVMAHIMIEPPDVIPTYYRERIADKAPEKVKKQRRPKGRKNVVSDVGKAINAKRTREGLSMAQLAEQLGVNVSQISRWENGKSNPRGKAMKKVQEWLGGNPE